MKSRMRAGVLGLVLLGMVVQLRLTTSNAAYAAQPGYVTTTGTDSNSWMGAVPARAPINDASAAVSPTDARARIQTDWGRMPLYFTANRGQMDGRVAFYIQAADKTLYFAQDGITFALTVPPRDSSPEMSEEQARNRWVVKLDFVGANPVRPIGETQTDAIISYFKGTPEEWHTGLPTYSKIVYPNLWDGIDLVYSGTVNRLKYEFLIMPGADPSRIQLAYRGATARVDDAGQLQVSTPAGGFQDDMPSAYQLVDGVLVPVQVGFEVSDTGPSSADPLGMEGPHSFGFHLGRYDTTLPLVIDPAVLVYAGYIGGSGIDSGYGIDVDAAGNAYVTGYTYSSEATFPVTIGPDLTFSGTTDTFVVKVNADGTALVYAGYIGGSGDDCGRAIAVDAAGNAYISGQTTSTAAFPVTAGPDPTHNGGYMDAFVAKVNADGTALVYAGYIGGNGWDSGNGIAVDTAGNAYIAGHTDSSQVTFPVTVGPDPTHNGGSNDAFVAKVNANGTALVYAGYVGGSGEDQGYGIAVDAAGNAYITGSTTSTEASFPVTVGPYLTFHGGTYGAPNDAFVAKVKADGTGLVYAGYIGGSGEDSGSGIAVDAAGNAYVTGYTRSTEETFAVTIGPDLTFNGGYNDAFVAKVKADGTGLVYAGYIGGGGGEGGSAIAIDTAGDAYITGYTSSSEATFPVMVGPDLTYNGGADAFVAQVRADGTALVNAGYIGGSEQEVGNGIALDAAGNAYVTGNTYSSEATFPVTVGPDLTHNGGSMDAFVAKVSSYRSRFATVSKRVNRTIASLGDSLSYTIAFIMSNDMPPGTVSVTDTLPFQLTYIPNSLSASSGSYGYSGGVITWNGIVNANTPVTITFGVTVSSVALYVVNTAIIDAGEKVSPSATVEVKGGRICNLVKHSPVLSGGFPESWEGAWVWSPTVLKESSNYKMWYTGSDFSNGWRIGYATSYDGITWAKHAGNPVLSASLSWEGTRVSYPTVINDNGTYKMWYSGRDSSGVTRIGYATSPDGSTWTKYSGNPVLNVGPSGAWDNTYVRNPSVIKVGGTFHLWYAGFDGARGRIGHATSGDGIHWTKDPANPVLSNGSPGSWEWTDVYAPNVVLWNDVFVMWYSGGTVPPSWQTGYATSSDGSTWTRQARVIPEGSAGAFDSDSADYASAIRDGTGFKIWYSGYNKGDYGAGTYRIVYATVDVCGDTPLPTPTNGLFLPLITKAEGASCSAYYTDNFSDPNSGWYIGNDSIRQFAYVGGEYQVWLKSPNYWTAVTPGAAGTDYTVSARARRVYGSGDYGIAFGITPGYSQFYAFLIDPPWYSIRAYNNGTWTALVPWSTSGYVTSGSNVLKVVRTGTSISAYSNNQLLASVNDGMISGWTRVGLIARSGSNQQDARFDDFTMYPASCGVSARARSAAFKMGSPENRGESVPPTEFKR